MRQIGYGILSYSGNSKRSVATVLSLLCKCHFQASSRGISCCEFSDSKGRTLPSVSTVLGAVYDAL